MSAAAVVLAAGASRRLGRPKQTVAINGETLVARAVRIAREAGLDPVIAVVADSGLVDALQSLGATVLFNPHAAEGIASSIRVGITGASGSEVCGAVLMTCDQVAVTATHLRLLCALPETATGSSYAGAVGIPAYFPVSSFADLLQLYGDRGARDLLRNARYVVNADLGLDVDAEADLLRVRERFQNKQFP